MKVALELQLCCGKRSGIGTYIYELAKRLTGRANLEFYGNIFNYAGKDDNTERLRGITMPILEQRLFSYGVYRRIWDWFPVPYEKMFPGGADLSIFFNYIVPPHIEGRVITTIHDLTWIRFPETMRRRNYRRLQKGVARSVVRSDLLLTVSEYAKNEIVTLLGIPEEKIFVVPNAPSLPEEAANWDETRLKYGIGKPYLLFVGTIEPRKNLVRLLQAFEQLKNEWNIPHQLVLAGGNGWQNAGIYKMAAGLTCADEIIFTGYILDSEKKTLYQNAAAFVFPSIYEGFGIPPLEAMVCGCPVVCSNAASLPEVVGEAARLVDPMDEKDIAQGIRDVLSDKNYASALISEGYRQAGTYSWDRSAKKLTEICTAFLEGA